MLNMLAAVLDCKVACMQTGSCSMQGLVAALQRGEDAGKQRAALLLWELLQVPGSGSTNTAVVSLCASSEGLVPGISWALHAGASAAAGVLHALVHDNHRCLNMRSCCPAKNLPPCKCCIPC